MTGDFKKHGLLAGSPPAVIEEPTDDVKILAEVVQGLHPEVIEGTALQVEQEPCPVYNTFGPSMYVREAHLPKGTFILGHEHTSDHLTVFVQGKIQYFPEEGGIQTWEAPMMYTAGPGRKSFVVLEDTVWLNIFHTDETEMCELENIFIVKSETWLNMHEVSVSSDYGFQAMLDELECSQVYLGENFISLPYGTYKCGIHYSPIHGKGVFATAEIEPDDCIGAARIKDGITPIGRYLNHSDNPNTALHTMGDDLYLFALRDIPGYRGGELGEELLIDYRQLYQGGKLCLGVQ